MNLLRAMRSNPAMHSMTTTAQALTHPKKCTCALAACVVKGAQGELGPEGREHD